MNRNDIVALIDAVDAVVGHAPHGRTTGAITWRARPRGASTSTGRMCLLNATVCTVMPMWMVMRGIQLIGAGAAAQVGMVGPVATMFMATMLLGEPFTASMPAGTLLVVAGIAWLSRAK